MCTNIGYSIQYDNSYILYVYWASLVAQMVKNLPAMWETWVQSQGWKDSTQGSLGIL